MEDPGQTDRRGGGHSPIVHNRARPFVFSFFLRSLLRTHYQPVAARFEGLRGTLPNSATFPAEAIRGHDGAIHRERSASVQARLQFVCFLSLPFDTTGAEI